MMRLLLFPSHDLNHAFLSGDDVYVNNKTSNGFTITSTLNGGFWGQLPDSGVDYIAAAQGETAVTSSFTLLSATASYVEQAQTASYALTASFALNNITFESLQVTNGTASIARDLPLPDDIEVIQPNTLNSSGNAYIYYTNTGATLDAISTLGGNIILSGDSCPIKLLSPIILKLLGRLKLVHLGRRASRVAPVLV